MTDKGQADCVGITQLENEHYLMFALESRRRRSIDVGWFFISTSKDLETTNWKYHQFWSQDLLLPNEKDLRTYENIELVTECETGEIYLLGFFGNGRSNAIDVFVLEKGLNDKITLRKIFERKIRTQAGGATFRAGASIHITPDHNIMLYSVAKSPKNNWLSIEEFR
jgi:hypothetical protein